MVGVTRIGRIGKDPRAALAFAVEMTNFFKQKYSETAQCWVRVGGPTGQLVWQMTFPDMGAIEKFNQQLLADSEYWSKVGKAQAQGLFDPASFEDGVWNQIA